MGVAALLLRDRVGYTARSTTGDSQGGYTSTYGSASYVRGRLSAAPPSAESLGDQLSGRAKASLVIDPRGITPKEGDRVVTRDGRTWDIMQVDKLTSPLGSGSVCDLAVLSIAEVLGT